MDISMDKKKLWTNKLWPCLRMGNLKRETESLLIAVQNNAIRAKYVKEKN